MAFGSNPITTPLNYFKNQSALFSLDKDSLFFIHCYMAFFVFHTTFSVVFFPATQLASSTSHPSKLLRPANRPTIVVSKLSNWQSGSPNSRNPLPTIQSPTPRLFVIHRKQAYPQLTVRPIDSLYRLPSENKPGRVPDHLLFHCRPPFVLRSWINYFPRSFLAPILFHFSRISSSQCATITAFISG